MKLNKLASCLLALVTLLGCSKSDERPDTLPFISGNFDATTYKNDTLYVFSSLEELQQTDLAATEGIDEKIDFNKNTLLYVQGRSPKSDVDVQAQLRQDEKDNYVLCLDIRTGDLAMPSAWSRALVVPKAVNKENIRMELTRELN